MSDGVFISDRPQLAIARQTVSFASLGLNDPTLTRIIYEVGNPYLSYIPTDEFNPISGITEGKSYLLYLNAFFDGSPALANAVLTNLIPQTATNVFADERVVFLCTDSVSFATAGITTGNTRLITLVSEGYFTSYDPNDTINGIDSFVEGELYDIDPITDIDLHLYGVTEIRYSDEVLYLDSLEDVVITNTNPDATLPLSEEEVLVRNTTTGVWENKPVSDLPTGTSYTDEQAQDAVGTILSSEFTYDDATPQISINQIAYSKITGTPSIPTQYTDEMAQDATAALLAAGTHTGITFTYTDASNKIDAAVTGSGVNALAAVGSTPNANAATLSGSTLNLEPASTLFPGVVTTGAQTIAGAKTWSGAATFNSTVVGTGAATFQVSNTTPFSSNYSTTNTTIVQRGLSLCRVGSNGANGSGIYIGFSNRNASASLFEFAHVRGVMTNSTNGAEVGDLEFWLANGGSVTNKATLKGDGSFIVAEAILLGATVTTANATPTNIKTLAITDETAGILEITLVGRESTTGGRFAAKKILSYSKDGGTLTLGTATTVLANEATGSIATATWGISVVSNNVSIDVTGVAATTINWKTSIRQITN